MSKQQPGKVTSLEYGGLESAYDWFNADLFDGRLPAVLLTLQRQKGAMGYFSADRFKARQGQEHTHELALNPAYFDGYTDMEILQTLVHEMCHVWQHHFGEKGRGGYHNKQWADKMELVGLMPSDTGKPGGKRTGDHMNDYIIAGGAFEVSATKLLEQGFRITWQSRENWSTNGTGAQGTGSQAGAQAGPKEPKPSKVKFTCPGCGQNAWGKPGLSILCGACSEPDCLVAMEPADSGSGD